MIKNVWILIEDNDWWSWSINTFHIPQRTIFTFTLRNFFHITIGFNSMTPFRFSYWYGQNTVFHYGFFYIASHPTILSPSNSNFNWVHWHWDHVLTYEFDKHSFSYLHFRNRTEFVFEYKMITVPGSCWKRK